MPRTKPSARIDSLRAIPLFADLPERTLGRIRRTMTEFDAPAGQVLVQPKMEGSGLFVIEEGTVVVERGTRRIEMGPGEFFGELALLTPAALRVARVRAKTPVRCLAISRYEFMKLLEAEPKIAISLLGTLAGRLAEAGR
jgi:CRP-like cAMP-binding protein